MNCDYWPFWQLHWNRCSEHSSPAAWDIITVQEKLQLICLSSLLSPRQTIPWGLQYVLLQYVFFIQIKEIWFWISTEMSLYSLKSGIQEQPSSRQIHCDTRCFFIRSMIWYVIALFVSLTLYLYLQLFSSTPFFQAGLLSFLINTSCLNDRWLNYNSTTCWDHPFLALAQDERNHWRQKWNGRQIKKKDCRVRLRTTEHCYKQPMLWRILCRGTLRQIVRFLAPRVFVSARNILDCQIWGPIVPL